MRISRLALMILVAVAGAARAQGIPRTAREAEAEGALFAREAADAAQAGWAARPARGTRERRCVPPRTPGDSVPVGSLRSGEFAIRAWFTVPQGFRVDYPHKILWLPLHPRTNGDAPLLIRAARLGQPADSIRLTVAGLTHSATGSEYGYLSTVSFPALGEWLVVATAGADWGCFLFTIASSQSR